MVSASIILPTKLEKGSCNCSQQKYQFFILISYLCVKSEQVSVTGFSNSAECTGDAVRYLEVQQFFIK